MSSAPIREPQAIAKLLARVIDERRPVSLWRAGADNAHASLLVGLKIPNGVYLDTPPQSLAEAYQKGDKLMVQTQLDGTELRFRTRFQLHSRYEGFPALLCEWPDEVQHQERRRAFRVRASGDRAAVELIGENDQHMPARLQDLSVGGFGALISQSARLQPGEMLDCSVEVRGQRLDTGVTVQSFQAVEGTRFWRVGARFEQLDPAQERLLGRLVLELQQQAIQTRRGH